MNILIETPKTKWQKKQSEIRHAARWDKAMAFLRSIHDEISPLLKAKAQAEELILASGQEKW